MATINYELTKLNKQGTRSVTFLILQGNEKRRLSTPISVTPTECTNNRISPRKAPKKYQIVHRKLTELQDKLIEVEMDYLGQHMDIDTLVQRITARYTNVDFFAFAEDWLSKLDIKGKKNYATFLNSLERYHGVRTLSVDSIDYSFLDGYCRSLRSKPRAQSLYMGNFRHIFKQICLHYDEIKNPFDRFKVPKQQLKGQRAMDLETLKKVFAYRGSGRAQLARDCAMLSFCLMGMNAVDLYNAKIYKGGKICYNRTKTASRRADNAYIEVAVPEVVLHLINKYKGSSRVFDFYTRYASPTDFGRAINIGLKKIDPTLQFYQFRHTWATIARNDLGIDYYTVGAALNHINRDDPVTDIYIKKDFTLINEANRKVIEYVFQIKEPHDK